MKRSTWAAEAETFARLHGGMAVEEHKTPGLFAKRYPALVGSWNGQHVTVWVSQGPNGRGSSPTHTNFVLGPVPGWPPGLRVFPRSGFGRSSGSSSELDARFVVKGGDAGYVSQWLDGRRQAAILGAGGGAATLSLSDQGITLVWQGTRSDGDWFAAGLGTVTGLAAALA